MAPTHFRTDDLHRIDRKPSIGWIRGTDDLIVSDTSLFDLAHLGALGAVPGWPDAEHCPAQPMLAQTRHTLDHYAATGTYVREDAVHRRPHRGPVKRTVRSPRADLYRRRD
ncbi:hypothetical protein [Streptomyces sp. Ncost-T10-10d]|uniref:hypothetical protein n=1 Tax=Streptomyces sp. Ncost-T10-10d TaxID=1839774 RepID=UPI00210B949C|nr:hypothetical protein [Streptomyces sp. Ncost-T10-10d]